MRSGIITLRFVLPLLTMSWVVSTAMPLGAQQQEAPAATPIVISDGTAPASRSADAMTPAELADIASRGITASNMFIEKYTYTETEHIQNFIDGQLQVDHTTVFENVFIHNLPYMRKTAFDGQPLQGKDLKRETALYDDAVKKRTALDQAARAYHERHALRSTSHTDLDTLATNFQLAVLGHEVVDGQDCVILDATPKPGNTAPGLARHIRMDIENTSQVVLDIRIEFLADDSGFSKGSVLDTHYTLIAGVPLPSHQTWDTTVRFKELLNKAIRIHRDITYTHYRRFHATVVIKMVAEASDGAAAAPETSVEKKEDKKVEADEKADAKAKAKADKKAQDDANRSPSPPPSPTFTPVPPSQ